MIINTRSISASFRLVAVIRTGSWSASRVPVMQLGDSRIASVHCVIVISKSGTRQCSGKCLVKAAEIERLSTLSRTLKLPAFLLGVRPSNRDFDLPDEGFGERQPVKQIVARCTERNHRTTSFHILVSALIWRPLGVHWFTAASLRMLWVVQSRDHSAATFSCPRRRNCRKPRACLINPKTGSTTCFRNRYRLR